MPVFIACISFDSANLLFFLYIVQLNVFKAIHAASFSNPFFSSSMPYSGFLLEIFVESGSIFVRRKLISYSRIDFSIEGYWSNNVLFYKTFKNL